MAAELRESNSEQTLDRPMKCEPEIDIKEHDFPYEESNNQENKKEEGSDTHPYEIPTVFTMVKVEPNCHINDDQTNADTSQTQQTHKNLVPGESSLEPSTSDDPSTLTLTHDIGSYRQSLSEGAPDDGITANSEDEQQEKRSGLVTCHPWPYINKFFTFVGRVKGRNYKFICELCRPNIKYYNANCKSLYNLKSHIKLKHIGSLDAFENAVQEGLSQRGELKRWSLGGAESPLPKRRLKVTSKVCDESLSERVNINHSGRVSQTSIEFFLYTKRRPRGTSKLCNQSPTSQLTSFDQSLVNRSSQISQTHVDRLVANLVIEEMLPFTTVDSPALKNLVQFLQPSKSVIDEAGLRCAVSESHDEGLVHLKEILSAVDTVATTADCWTCCNRCYMCVSAHWIDTKSFQRKNSLLACRRLTKWDKYDPIARDGGYAQDGCRPQFQNPIAKELEALYEDFGIRTKIVRTTVDNGCNFNKAFTLFGTGGYTTNSTSLTSSEKPGHCSGEARVDDQLSFVHLSHLFEDSLSTSSSDWLLSQYHRCVSHTLNVVATVDARNALEDSTFCSVSKTAFGKAYTLWERVRGNDCVDLNLKELQEKLQPPLTDTWNATYEGICHLQTAISTKESTMQEICDKLKIPKFTTFDKSFFKEFISVMKPLVQTLDILEKEKEAYMGILLPTLTICMKKLRKIQQKPLESCLPLAVALLSGVETRFTTVMQNENNLLASAFHPRFKLDWLEDHTQLDNIKKMMINKLENARKKVPITMESPNQQSPDSSCDNDFFSCLQMENNRKDKNIFSEKVTSFLSSPNSKHIYKYVFPCPEFETCFLTLNSPVPTSAAVKTLFSGRENNVFCPSELGLSDEYFEKKHSTTGSESEITSSPSTSTGLKSKEESSEWTGKESCFKNHLRWIKCPKCQFKTRYKGNLKTHLLKHSNTKKYQCTQCHYTANQKHNLENHVLIHSGVTYGCPDCTYTTHKKSNLDKHSLTHEQYKEFQCKICMYGTNNKAHLNSHMLSHSSVKRFMCSECDYGTNRKAVLIAHLLEHQGIKEFKCAKCSYATNRKNDLKEHLLTHTRETKFSCSLCDYKTRRKTSLVTHFLIHTGDKRYECLHCDYRVNQRSCIVNHLVTHSKKYPTGDASLEIRFQCPVCDFMASGMQDLQDHLLTHDVKRPVDFSCPECEFTTSEKVQLHHHSLTHCESKPGEEEFECPECDFTTLEKSELHQHLFTHNDTKPVEENFQCPECEFTTPEKIHLHQHLLTHGENRLTEENYQCSECSFTTREKIKLHEHLLTHGNVKPIKCRRCDFITTRESLLNTHALIHSKFRCLKCDFVTNLKRNYNLHLQTHSTVMNYECTECPYATNLKRKLESHLRTHTGNTELECSVCNFKTKNKNSLHVHLLSHAGIKRFKCLSCTYGTNRKKDFDTHVLTHLRQKMFRCYQCDYSTNYKADLINHTLTHAGIKKYTCQQCDYGTNRKDDLRSHLISHTDVREFGCEDCEFKAKRKNTLRQHMLRTHKKKL